jgi:hypothetical protein
VNGSGVGQDCLYVAWIHTDRNGSSTLSRSLFAKFYKPFAIKLPVTKLTKPSVKKGQTGILRPPDLLADFLKILSVNRDEIAKKLGVSRSRCRWLLTINSPLNIQRPFLGVFPAKERLIDVLSFAADLDPPRS